jgi:RNA polymerase sigma-B factor
VLDQLPTLSTASFSPIAGAPDTPVPAPSTSASPLPNSPLPVQRNNQSHRFASAPSDDVARQMRDLLNGLSECSDETERLRRRRAVVTTYLPVAWSLAARYSGRGVDRSDLRQLACLGLVKAVNRWVPGRSEDFLQFAVPTIVGEIKRYFRDHLALVRPPRRVSELRAGIEQVREQYWERHGRYPTEAEIARLIGASPEAVAEARASTLLCHPRSTDEPHGGDSTIADSFGSEDQALGRAEDRLTTQRLLMTLTPNERAIVRMRFEEGWSQSRIGAELGVSQMQVSRTLRSITQKLHRALVA